MPPYSFMPHTLTESQHAQAGVFVVRNTRDTRVYIGASQHLLRAYRQAHKDLRAGQHSARGLQAFATTHGLGRLRFEVLALCPPSELASTKQRYLDQLRACDPAHGFNSLNPAAPAGQKMSAAARARLSAGKQGRPVAKRTAAHQEKLAAAHRGRTRSPETRARISAATRGKPKRPRPP